MEIKLPKGARLRVSVKEIVFVAVTLGGLILNYARIEFVNYSLQQKIAECQQKLTTKIARLGQ